MSIFDEKFNISSWGDIPNSPGVYRFLDAKGAVIYVGRAKRLRRRLGQYRLAGPRKKHRRMRGIVKEAHALNFITCESHLDACELEVRLIQELRPKWNIVSAFNFLYPYIGLKADGSQISFVYTTKVPHPEGFIFFGAYRSRDTVGAAFFGLMELLGYVGHRSNKTKTERANIERYTFVETFRQLPSEWVSGWEDFFRGRSRFILEDLTLRLLNNVKARSIKNDIQEKLDAVLQFWQLEALTLARAISATGYQGVYPVPQEERDPLFIRYREI